MSEKEIWLAIAGSSTLFFVLKLLLSFWGIGSDDFELDHSSHEFESIEAFKFLSLQGVLAFLMGSGWMGLALRYEYEFSFTSAVLGAFSLGLILMFISSFALFQVSKLNHKPNPSSQVEIGSRGRAYISIPKNGTGSGKIQVTIGERLQVINALSEDSFIPSGSNIYVSKVSDSGIVWVKPIDKLISQARDNKTNKKPRGFKIS
ncbi:MAG: hypothetical protein AB8G05_00585 [Oligoflexales bacterium]